MNIEENGVIRKMTVDDIPKLEDALDRIAFLEEQQHNWRISSVCRELKAETENLKQALRQARAWGVRSAGFSAEQSHKLSIWIDEGMAGTPPPLPDYYTNP